MRPATDAPGVPADERPVPSGAVGRRPLTLVVARRPVVAVPGVVLPLVPRPTVGAFHAVTRVRRVAPLLGLPAVEAVVGPTLPVAAFLAVLRPVLEAVGPVAHAGRPVGLVVRGSRPFGRPDGPPTDGVGVRPVVGVATRVAVSPSPDVPLAPVVRAATGRLRPRPLGLGVVGQT